MHSRLQIYLRSIFCPNFREHAPEAAVQAVERHPISQLIEFLKTNKRPQVEFVSTSHVTTADVFDAMYYSRQFNLKHTAALVFDHHADVHPDHGLPNKASVFNYLLDKAKLLDRVAIIGTHEGYSQWSFGATTIISGRELYNDVGPNRAKFFSNLSDISMEWRKSGIMQVYTSVDLDGLRLSEQGYTATDYNPVDQVRAWMRLPSVQAHIEAVLQQPRLRSYDQKEWDDTDRQTAQLMKIFARSLQQDMFARKGKTRPYFGVPAAWVIQGVDFLREQGFHIGVSSQSGQQRVLGDVVEYVGRDHRHRTAKIAAGILNGLAFVGQQPTVNRNPENN